MAKRLPGFWFLLLLLAFFLLVEPASPQSIWLDRSIDRAIWLEVQKADFTREYLGGGNLPHKTTFATSTLFLSIRWRVSGPLVLRAELPFVNAGIKDQNYVDPFGDTIQIQGASENQFGNPLVGVEFWVPGSPIFTEIGLQLPIVDDRHLFSSAFGAFTDFDRFEAFLPDLLTVTTIINYQYHAPTGLLLRLRFGTAFFVPTENGPDAELFYDYSAQVGYQLNRVSATVGLTGRALISEIGVSFGERTAHQLGLSGHYTAGRFIPGILFRLPMDDDLSEIVDFVFGLSVGYRLP